MRQQSKGQILSADGEGARAPPRRVSQIGALCQRTISSPRRGGLGTRLMRETGRMPGIRRMLRNPAGSVEQDVDEEVAFHIESRIDELRAAGADAETARRVAEAEVGDLAASRRELKAVDRRRHRRQRVSRFWDATKAEFRHAARSLIRAPAFTIAAVLTLAAGSGAGVSIFASVSCG